MKKRWSLLLTLVLSLSLTACGEKTPDPDLPPMEKEGAETVTLRLVDGAETGTLLLAGEGAGEVYTLTVGDIPVLMGEGSADASMLEDGMELEITYNGTVLETFPGRLGGITAISAPAQRPGGTYYDLCGLYLQVLNDLWDADAGLNSGVEYVSVDLSQAPGGLTEGEKAAIAWTFAADHNVEGLTMTLEELEAEGYLSEVHLDSAPPEKPILQEWKNGVYFAITPGAGEKNETYSLPALRFDAEKWRGPLGAYWFGDCFCVWPEFGPWTDYQVGNEAIS